MSQDTQVAPRSRLSWTRNLPAIAVGLTFLVVLVLLFLPQIGHRRAGDVARGAVCRNNLKQIGISLQTYHDAYKSFPPAVVSDQHGNPMHSWRAILLPYFDIKECQELGKRYRFDEPWNGPHNQSLRDAMPEVYSCPKDVNVANVASYLAIVGPETMWRDDKPMNIRETTDGTSKTIALVECANSGVNWLEPRDVAFEDASWGINNRSTRPSIRSNHVDGAMVLFVDGSAHFLESTIDRQILRGLLTPAGDEDVDVPE